MTPQAAGAELAYPLVRPDPQGGYPYVSDGLTKREYFAAMADVSAYEPIKTFMGANGRAPTVNELAAYIADIRRIEADALLAALQDTP